MSKACGVYIHIPFCRSKCHYCDFVSFSGKDEFTAFYIDALTNEIRSCEILHDISIDTIYFGGGTPGYLSADALCGILDEFSRYRLETPEITIEMNPGSVDTVKLRQLKRGGFNRISFGLQAVQDRLLWTIGRTHSFAEFISNYEAARKAGFGNISLDLMFSLPSQSMDDWLESLGTVISIQPEHISAYSLTINEHTVFGERLAAGELILPSDEQDREFYHSAIETLGRAGYKHYEISNFAQQGKESRHNQNCWDRVEYLGFGLAAHSFYGGERYNNTSELNMYMKSRGLAAEDRVKLTKRDEMEETVILGLRFIDGVSQTRFQERYGIDINSVFGGAIKKNITSGLLVQQGDMIKLTKTGLDLANMVMSDFMGL